MNELLINGLSELDWLAMARHALPLLIVFAAGILVLIAEWFVPNEKVRHVVAGGIALISSAAAIVLSWNGWPSAGSVSIPLLSLDKLAVFSWMLVLFSLFSSAMLYMGAVKGRGLAGIMFSAFGCLVAVASNDLIMFFLSFEIMSLGILFAMPSSKTFYLHIFASTFFVMGISFIFGSSGTLELSSLASRVFEIVSGEGRAFFLFGIAMVTVGFALKIAIFPFHLWFVDTASETELPVAAFFTTGFLFASIVAFARFALACGIASTTLWQHTIAIAAIVSIVLSMLAALKEDDLKKIFIYLAMAGAAFSLIAFAAMVKEPIVSMKAVLVNMTAMLIANIGVFAAIGTFAPTFYFAKLSGTGKTSPFFAAAFAILILSVAASPVTFGFFGKLYVIDAVSKGSGMWLVITGAIAGVLMLAVAARLVSMMYLHEEPKLEREARPISLWSVVMLAITAFATVFFGIYPTQILALITSSV